MIGARKGEEGQETVGILTEEYTHVKLPFSMQGGRERYRTHGGLASFIIIKGNKRTLLCTVHFL